MITTLDLSFSNIGAAGVQALAEVLPHATIKELDLSATHIGAAGAQALAEILPHTTIKELDLSGNNIGAAGVQALAKVLPRTTIKELDLSGNNIGATGVQALAEVLPHTTIKELDLGFNRIGDADVQALAEVLPHTTIKELSITNGNTELIKCKLLMNNTMDDRLNPFVTQITRKLSPFVKRLDELKEFYSNNKELYKNDKDSLEYGLGNVLDVIEILKFIKSIESEKNEKYPELHVARAIVCLKKATQDFSREAREKITYVLNEGNTLSALSNLIGLMGRDASNQDSKIGVTDCVSILSVCEAGNLTKCIEELLLHRGVLFYIPDTNNILYPSALKLLYKYNYPEVYSMSKSNLVRQEMITYYEQHQALPDVQDMINKLKEGKGDNNNLVNTELLNQNISSLGDTDSSTQPLSGPSVVNHGLQNISQTNDQF